MNDAAWDALMDERSELEAYTFDEFMDDDLWVGTALATEETWE